MGTTTLNEYRIDYADNRSEIFMAESVRSAADAKETGGRPIAQITRMRVNVGVDPPIRGVKFSTAVTPESAGENKCLATPETWVVKEADKVIFTAIPAEGFVFDGWYMKGGDTTLSTEPVTELQVDYPADPAALAAEFEARFSPIP